jgi:hypothetical protein
MVENVKKQELELGVEALCELDIFSHAKIHVPVRQTAYRTIPVVAGCDAQNGIHKLAKRCYRI